MPNNKNQNAAEMDEEKLREKAPDSPTILYARAMVEEQIPDLSKVQLRFFEKQQQNYRASDRGRKDKAAFFASIRPETLMAVKPNLEFVEHEEHGIRKHVGGQQSGSRWLIDEKQKTKKLENALEGFLTENYTDFFSKEVQQGEIISFDIIGDMDDLKLGLRKESFDYFKLQVTVWRDDDEALKVSYHGYPYKSANPNDLDIKVVKSEKIIESKEMPASKGSFS